MVFSVLNAEVKITINFVGSDEEVTEILNRNYSNVQTFCLRDINIETENITIIFNTTSKISELDIQCRR